MPDPISDVPNTSVITCIVLKTARVAHKPVQTDTPIEKTEARIGFGERNI